MSCSSKVKKILSHTLCLIASLWHDVWTCSEIGTPRNLWSLFGLVGKKQSSLFSMFHNNEYFEPFTCFYVGEFNCWLNQLRKTASCSQTGPPLNLQSAHVCRQAASSALKHGGTGKVTQLKLHLAVLLSLPHEWALLQYVEQYTHTVHCSDFPAQSSAVHIFRHS